MAFKLVANEIIESIKFYLGQQGIGCQSIYLFGSRSRGDNKPDSDFDIMIILDENLAHSAKRKLSVQIKSHLIKKNILYQIDLIIKNHDRWVWESANIGFLSHTVKTEGLLL
jgi:predicted nucleotidyltransferase